MPAYLLLLEPSPNRVYRDAAPALVAEEARRLLGALTGATVQASPTEVAGVAYLGVETEAPLDEVGFRALSSLSGVYAIFTAEGELLRPVAAERVDRYPSDLLTIQKYQGKTNEQLTRTLLNLTAAATSQPQRLLDGSMSVLDPMCGRGTTLNLALTYGLDVTGIDLDKRDFEEFERFLKTWLRQHRYKHTADTGTLRTHGRHRGRRFDATVAPTKEEFKRGDVQRVTYLGTDTTDLDGLLKPRQFDVLVTDSPYGVQHGSHGDRIARNPLELLDDALPVWVPLLRRTGALGMAYNRHVARPDQLAELLEQHGLTIVGDPADEIFRHRVDASIDRDLIIATVRDQ